MRYIVYCQTCGALLTVGLGTTARWDSPHGQCLTLSVAIRWDFIPSADRTAR